ncbi:MAG: 16S rRNA (adenine(1518)-N(6)/adenine(1519)-N(6))-dimethyltransferase RsmA [Candidatus Dormibacteria bacterium]
MAPRRSRRPLDLCDPATVRAVSRRAGLSPQHRLGQNFLVDRAVLDTIVSALAPDVGDDILEIGTGIGTLTAVLAARARHVVSMEIDPASVRAARMTLRSFPNVDIVEGDALRIDASALGLTPPWLAAGNLPYSLTSPLLNHLFEAGRPPTRGVFLVQREVAHRLAAPSGDWSLATVAIRSLADVERLTDVAPACFQPPPAVHSSVIRMHPAPLMSPAERQEVLELARPAFQMRRKTLRHGITRALAGNATAAARVLDETGIDPARRPGTLSLEEWRSLAAASTSASPPPRSSENCPHPGAPVHDPAPGSLRRSRASR